jgi:polyhydroxyalkanoate synthase
VALDDPPTTTPFDVVYEGGLLRLRHYGAADGPDKPPVLLVYSLFKRPYILDLLPDRSVVRSFLHAGFSVYVTDWLPPRSADSERGLHEYIDLDLASAVACVRRREGVAQVSMVGCCWGAMLAVIYAALYPHTVRRLVPVALPLQVCPPLVPEAVDYVARTYGNVPAWLIRAGLNAGVPGSAYLPLYLASELGEPVLAQSAWGPRSALRRVLQRWLGSDVSLAGRIFREVMQDVDWDGQLAASRLYVADRRVVLGQIRCAVLNINGECDRLAPPSSAAALVACVGSRDASNLIFPTGHLGLLVSLAAQQSLWPRVCAWLREPRRVANLRLVVSGSWAGERAPERTDGADGKCVTTLRSVS